MEEVNKAMMKQFPIEDMKDRPFHFPKDPEVVLKQLLFMLKILIQLGFTLSVICPSDFIIRDKVLFLNRNTHVVPLSDPFVNPTSQDKCFVPDMPKEDLLSVTYASVGLFTYYLWTRKKKTKLSESDYGNLKGTKVYYFIKNAMEKNPILLYL
jgi:hypothetical protein